MVLCKVAQLALIVVKNGTKNIYQPMTANDYHYKTELIKNMP